ncbi:MAG: hypothetical protein HRF42_02130 [Candidatus Brocadia sp.]|jgi:hypothetical protein
MKRLTFGVLAVAMSLTISLNSVFAKSVSGGGRRPMPAPEPVSCLLFLAGGATMVAIRRLKIKWDSKTLHKHAQNDMNDVSS